MGLFDGLKSLGEGFAADFRPPEDGSAINPDYGVPEADVYAQRMGSLRQMGALYAAAGAARGDKRAEILAKIADVRDPTNNLYKATQTRLMQQQIQDGLDQRSRRERALQVLGSTDFGDTMTEKEKMFFGTMVEAGDNESAIEYLMKISDANTQSHMLSDGSYATRGQMVKNQENWLKTEKIKIDGAAENLQLVTDTLDLLNGGFIAGAFADKRVMLDKARRLAGGLSQEEVARLVATEQGRIKLLKLGVQQLRNFGGNDSERELKASIDMFGGSDQEAETIKAGLSAYGDSVVREATRAQIQGQRLQQNGQAEYGMPVEFKVDDIDPTFRPFYDKIHPAQPADTATVSGPAGKADKVGGGSNAPAAKTFKDRLGGW